MIETCKGEIFSGISDLNFSNLFPQKDISNRIY